MSEALKALWQLQLVDLDIDKNRKALAALDDGSSKKQQVERIRAQSEEADRLLHEAATEQRDKELNIKTLEEKKKQLNDKMYSGKVGSPKELQSMQEEVAMFDRQRGKLEERILELMDIIEERTATAEKAAAILKESQEKLEAYLAKLAENRRILTKNLEVLAHRRETAVSHVDPALLKRYEHLQSRIGVLAMGKLEGNQCGGCHTGLVSFQLRQLEQDKEIAICENCGRILYREKE